MIGVRRPLLHLRHERLEDVEFATLE
jgi:hypothetical protein